MGQFHDILKNELIKCHQHGDFALSSGNRANDYYDLAPLFLSPSSLRTVSNEVMSALDEVVFDALGCVELCPVPLLGAILSHTFVDKRGFVVRKSRKGHGTDKLIEGDLRSNDRVAVLEDVTSTGRSVLRAVSAIEELGCKVVLILVIINRQEGCDELLKDYDFKYLFTSEELER